MTSVMRMEMRKEIRNGRTAKAERVYMMIEMVIM